MAGKYVFTPWSNVNSVDVIRVDSVLMGNSSWLNSASFVYVRKVGTILEW